jgi:hypothetical protein
MRKFKAYMERKSHSFFIKKVDWDNIIKPNAGTLLSVDIEQTPIRSISQSEGYLGAIARPATQADYVIEVYRHDEKDELPINCYTYSVFEDIIRTQFYQETVNACSTHDDYDLREKLCEFVLMTPNPKDSMHWLLTVPSSVSLVIKPV